MTTLVEHTEPTKMVRHRSEAPTALALTVLLPAYNEMLAIRRVLEEVVEVVSEHGGAQDYEILVVDDCSTDATPEIVEEFAAYCLHCSIRLIRSRQRQGAGAARTVGIGSVLTRFDISASLVSGSTGCRPATISNMIRPRPNRSER